MSKIVVNGVDGNFGGLVAKYVLDLVDKKDLVFTAPKIEKLKEYQEMGIAVAKANFNDIAGLLKDTHMTHIYTNGKKAHQQRCSLNRHIDETVNAHMEVMEIKKQPLQGDCQRVLVKMMGSAAQALLDILEGCLADLLFFGQKVHHRIFEERHDAPDKIIVGRRTDFQERSAHINDRTLEIVRRADAVQQFTVDENHAVAFRERDVTIVIIQVAFPFVTIHMSYMLVDFFCA